MGTSVTGVQLFGYIIALAGLQAYGAVSKDTAAFEDAGLLPVLWQKLQLGGFLKEFWFKD
jgi:hypothetical protein